MKNIDKCVGSLVGLTIGDAVGTTLEFKQRDTYQHITDMVGGGPFRLNVGEWTDDTSMALALGDALLSHGMDQTAILQNFSDWFQKGKFSHNNRCFDIGGTTRNAIMKFMRTGDPVCGDPYFLNSGNGGIMRLAPAVLFANSLAEASTFSRMQSETTHNSPDCMDCAGNLGHIIWNLITENDTVSKEIFKRPVDITLPTRDSVNSSGYVKHTYDAALWCWVNSNSFEEAILLAANLGDDADTVAAVTGQIVGADYGYSAIPEKWLSKLVWHDYIVDMAKQLSNGND